MAKRQGGELTPYLLSSADVTGLDLLGETIGHGSYGAVYEVTVKDVPCIAKRLHGILVSQKVSPAQRIAIQQQFRKECLLLSSLRHPNIVHFIGIHCGRDPDDLSLIMERLHTDLGAFLETLKSNPSRQMHLSVKISILLDVSYGLYYLHSLTSPVIHRDLSANNVLLSTKLQAKIADLGVSKLLDPDMYARATAKHTVAPGSQNYMPPEALKENPKYDEKLDVFSFGHLTLYTVTEMFLPVYEVTITPDVLAQGTIHILKRRKALDMVGKSHPLYQMTISCLHDHLEHRPTVKELMELLKNLNSQHPMTIDDIAQAMGEAQAFQRDLEQVQRDLEIAHEELATTTQICRGRIEQLEDQVTRLAALEGAHQSEVGALMVAIAHRDDEVAQANIQCQQLRCELQSKAQQLSEQTEINKSLKHLMEEVRKQLEKVSGENEGLRKEKERLMKKKKAATGAIDKAISTSMTGNDDLQTEVTELRRVHKDICEENATLREQLGQHFNQQNIEEHLGQPSSPKDQRTGVEPQAQLLQRPQPLDAYSMDDQRALNSRGVAHPPPAFSHLLQSRHAPAVVQGSDTTHPGLQRQEYQCSQVTQQQTTEQDNVTANAAMAGSAQFPRDQHQQCSSPSSVIQKHNATAGANAHMQTQPTQHKCGLPSDTLQKYPRMADQGRCLTPVSVSSYPTQETSPLVLIQAPTMPSLSQDGSHYREQPPRDLSVCGTSQVPTSPRKQVSLQKGIGKIEEKFKQLQVEREPVSLSSDNVPFDPNLICPICGLSFRLGQIQKFRNHLSSHVTRK